MDGILPHHPEFLARHVLSLAIDDEISARGSAALTDTLACFIEHRIAEAIRNVMPDEAVVRRRYDA
jgi:hypothetical protein